LHFGFVAYVYLLPFLGVLNSNFVTLTPNQTVTLILCDVIKNPVISHSTLHEVLGLYSEISVSS